MSSRIARRLSYAALLSTSLSCLVVASQAHATSRGVPANSPLTIDNGSVLETVGGSQVPDPDGARGISWSPDGSKVTYEVAGAAGAIVVANADGSDRKQVGAGAGYFYTDHPIFAYDGELLVYSGSLANGSRSLFATWANGSAIDLNGVPHQWQLPDENTPVGAADVRPDYGGGIIAFERQMYSDGSTSIYVRSAANGFVPFKVAAGSQPTVSPDGATVAFVAPDAHNQEQVWTVPTTVPGGSLPTPVQQTFLASGTIADAAFSPDGRTIAFVADPVEPTPGVYYTVRTVALNADPAATSNPETIVPTSLPIDGATSIAYRTEFPKPIVTEAGADRFATAVDTSGYVWRTNGDTADKTRGQAKTVVLSRSDTYADALGGAVLAAHKGGPLLLTPSDSLDASVLREMQRILPKGATVYLLGGTSALSPAVEAEVRQAGFATDRIAGATRYETSVDIAKASVAGVPDNILIATGQNFPDALSAGAAAASDPDSVVVLSDDNVMPAETGDYLLGFNTDFGRSSTIGLWTVGGQARDAVDGFSKQQWYRYDEAGATRFDTSVMLAHDFFPYMSSVGFATAYNFPDSLAGGALMGEEGGPLLLVDPQYGLTPAEQALVDDNRSELYSAFLFGGQVATSLPVQREVRAGVLGPMGEPPIGALTSGVTPSIAHSGSAAAGVRDSVTPGEGKAGAGSAGIEPSRPGE